MRTSVWILACSLLVASLASAQPAAPSGPPPTFSVVASTQPEKGTIVLMVPVEKSVLFTVQEKNVVNGKEVVVNKVIVKTEFVWEQISYDAAKSRIITPDGKQLPIDEVWKRLKKNTVVAVSADANTPAAAYLRALGAETLVIIFAPPAPMKK